MSDRWRRALRDLWAARAPPRFGVAWRGKGTLDDVWTPALLRAAYDVAMPGAAIGVDGLYPSCVTGPLLDHTCDQVRERRYTPAPLRTFALPKSGRMVGVPTVLDQVLIAAWKLWAEPILESTLSPTVWGFRPGRDRHGAIRALIRPRGGSVLIRCDVRKMFESLNHRHLDRAGADVWGWKPDTWWRHDRTLAPWLMDRWLSRWSPGVGVPTGISVSPLWANAYMRSVDAAIEADGRVLAYTRYGDDITVLATSPDALREVGRAVAAIGLRLNAEKTRVHHLAEPRHWPAKVLGIDLIPAEAGGLARARQRR